MRIGIVPTNYRSAGGTFQHSLSFLDTLRHAGMNDRYVVFHRPGTDLPVAQIRGWGFETAATTLLEHGSLVRAGAAWGIFGADRLFSREPVSRAWRSVRRRLRTAMGQPADGQRPIRVRSRAWHTLFACYRVDLMVYLVEMDCVLEADVPYVATIHDVLHRSEQRFAEAFVHGSAAYYDRLYAGTACRAAAILVHDETVKADLLQYYGREGVQRDRIHVLPLQPAPYLRHGAALEEIREHYGLPVEYLFCPARLWPHKNHLRLLEALRLLKTRCGMVIPLVLTGFDSSDSPPPGETPLYVLKQAARERGLDEQVRYLGMVPDAHVAGLYEGARALVMPTFCPPLAIPVFEAWALGCPVVTSDLRGIREPAGDAAITVDPASSDAIAEGIARVWTDEALRATLTERGRERAAAMTPECHAARLSQILAEAKSRMAERPYPACEAAPA